MSLCSTSWQRYRCVNALSFHISHKVELGVFFFFGIADGPGVRSIQSSHVKNFNSKSFLKKKRNKWVLNKTETPLFFLWMQLAIAAVLFVISDVLRMLPDRLTFDLKTCKGLVPMVGLNVIGLRFASFLLYRTIYSIHILSHSFSNYTLKYVDASFYQVARGLVLPFTVCVSFLMLSSRPSLRILLCCATVTFGFFIGVFLDGTPLSVVGVSFGVASSAITAIHSVVIKQSLNVVNGSALALSWYTNLLSAAVLAPLLILAGEGPDVLKLLFGVTELIVEPDTISPLQTFIWGSIITVSPQGI